MKQKTTWVFLFLMMALSQLAFAQTAADIEVLKTDTPDPVNAGDQITYTIDVNNLSTTETTGTVTITDVIPANTTFVSVTPETATCSGVTVGGTGTLTCTVASLAPGADEILTLVVEVNANVAAGSTITNAATATAANNTDPNPTNNTAVTTTTAVATSADLAVTKAGTPQGATAGEQVSFAIDVDNLGPSDAQNVVITDVIPAGTTFVSVTEEASTCIYDPITTTVTCTMATLAAGQDELITLVVQVDPDFPGTFFTNTVTVTSDTTDPNAANNTANDNISVAFEADLTITKTGRAEVNAGGQAQYVITVTNQGPSDAQNVIMEDVLPADTTFVDITEPAGFTCTTPAVGATGTVTCTATTLAAGATAEFTLTVQVDPNLTSGTVIENTATVTSTTTDPTPGNNATTVTARAMVPGIPTVSEWGLLAMMMALAAFGALRLRS